jgi:hypothetical protein
VADVEPMMTTSGRMAAGRTLLFAGMEDSTMSQAKQASRRNRRRKTVPVLGAAGLSLSLTGGASAATGGMAADLPTHNTAVNHEITLGDEEVSGVSLGTFYVFDKENEAALRQGIKVARCGGGCGRGCGCGGRGCGCGGRGCGGCGCGGWGGCGCFGGLLWGLGGCGCYPYYGGYGGCGCGGCRCY